MRISAFETTRRARSSVPSSSTTPATRRPRVRIFVTALETRISAPRSRAAAARASLIPPMPPRT